MGYRGKVREREQARDLRASGHTLLEIATAVNVSKSSVSVWVRDVAFTPSPRRYAPHLRRQPLRERRLRGIDAFDCWGRRQIGTLSDRDLLVAGTALYAGEGAKRDHMVLFANTDAAMIQLFCAWLQRFFDIDEARLRVRVYLHEGLDLDRAEAHWSTVTGIPRSQFGAAW